MTHDEMLHHMAEIGKANKVPIWCYMSLDTRTEKHIREQFGKLIECGVGDGPGLVPPLIALGFWKLIAFTKNRNKHRSAMLYFIGGKLSQFDPDNRVIGAIFNKGVRNLI